MTETQQKFFSFSGGVESRVLALMFGHTAKGIFADTGWEHDALYEELNKFESVMRRKNTNFEIIRVRNKKHDSLSEYIKKYKYFPSFNQRFCTREFKIEPIDEFLKDQGECELMIGLNADEANMRTGNIGMLSNVNYTYPLIDYGITREQCEEILKSEGVYPDFPIYMQRGGCKGCFFKSRKEFVALAVLNQSEAWELVELEESIQDERKQYYSMRDCIPNMREFIKYHAKNRLPFSEEELYQEQEYSHSPCGVFCHR